MNIVTRGRVGIAQKDFSSRLDFNFVLFVFTLLCSPAVLVVYARARVKKDSAGPRGRADKHNNNNNVIIID